MLSDALLIPKVEKKRQQCVSSKNLNPVPQSERVQIKMAKNASLKETPLPEYTNGLRKRLELSRKKNKPQRNKSDTPQLDQSIDILEQRPGAASDTQPDYQKTIRSTKNIVQDEYNSPTYQKTQLSTKNIVEHTRKKLEIKQIEREKMLYERTVANLEKLTSEIGKKVSLLHDLLQQRNLIHNNSSNMQPLASNINILTSQISAVKKDLAQHEKNLRSLQNGFIVSPDH